MKHTAKRLLCLVLIAATLCAFLVPNAAAADSMADKVKAVLETTLAYYYKNPYMQYDSVQITNAREAQGGTLRTNRYVAPEFGTAQRNIYTVCSSFCWEVYYNTFGYELMGNPRNSETIDLGTKTEAPLLAFTREDINDKNIDQVIADFDAALQPGDIIVYLTRDDSPGHAMMFVGDIDGDGTRYMIHSSGSKYNMSSGQDGTEPKGNILKEPVDTLYKKQAGSRYLGLKKSVHIIRPLAADCKDYDILPVAKQRMKFSGLSVDRTVDCGLYGSPVTGGEMTYQLVIKNNSKGDYTVPVKETVPEGTTLVTANGLSGTTALTADVALKAGESKTVSYTVKVTAPRGTVIVNGGGSVAEIPSNVLKNRVAAKADFAALQSDAWRSKVAAAKPAGLEFANAVYREALGKELGLTTMDVLTADMFKVIGLGTYQLDNSNAMLIDNYFGGAAVLTPWETINDRIFELRPEQLQAGDIFIGAGNNRDKAPTVYVSTGKELLGIENGKIVAVNTAKLMVNFKKNLFFAIRPMLAVDTLPDAKAASLPFTDVKQGDWYYDFVSELYGKKIVSGMTATTFVPNGQLTYGQALKLVVVGLGNPEQASVGGNWASGYLAFAKSKGWLAADVDLNAPISRLAFCQIAAKAKNLTKQPAANPFKDCADKDVLALVNAGIINGMSADTFSPNTTLTRAQISKIISGLIK